MSGGEGKGRVGGSWVWPERPASRGRPAAGTWAATGCGGKARRDGPGCRSTGCRTRGVGGGCGVCQRRRGAASRGGPRDPPTRLLDVEVRLDRGVAWLEHERHHFFEGWRKALGRPAQQIHNVAVGAQTVVDSLGCLHRRRLLHSQQARRGAHTRAGAAVQAVPGGLQQECVHGGERDEERASRKGAHNGASGTALANCRSQLGHAFALLLGRTPTVEEKGI